MQSVYSGLRKQLGGRLNALVFSLCIASLLAFAAGCYLAFDAIRGIAANEETTRNAQAQRAQQPAATPAAVTPAPTATQ